jgi:capsular exopolysaccharide synthesis family protein
MSKLFDIMSGGKGELADMFRPLVAGTGESQPESAKAATPSAPETLASESPAPTPALGAEIRVQSLRVPAPSPLLPFEQGQWRPGEQYRILRTKLVQHPKQPRVMVISSPASGDGKSVSAINTAAALSLKGEGHVLLVDSDIRRSAVHHQLGLPESPGLAEVLKGACTMEQAIVRTQEFPNLFVMPAGTPPENPVELLDSVAWQTLIGRLRTLFRYVILDSPPVGAVADYDLIQAACDGVILVIRPDHTDRTLCQRALAAVPKPKLLGILLNCVPDWSPGKQVGSDYYYYYSGGKEYQSKREAEPPNTNVRSPAAVLRE